jgi:hypothetical protein
VPKWRPTGLLGVLPCGIIGSKTEISISRSSLACLGTSTGWKPSAEEADNVNEDRAASDLTPPHPTKAAVNEDVSA